ncbi:hypothetical protein Acr_05g0007880 [Actinidia rufa]|uniref:Uncharacterized protein n=1 Tax=Actinidia rufa TaxID=165716 RepID=A0A7J0EMD3_9ERIC|nr:hypothetical protein Acr_05g0007880 [Actinidia rufa]
MASSNEMTWRGSMDSFYLDQEGSEIEFGVLNAEMGLRRMEVWRCSVPLRARADARHKWSCVRMRDSVSCEQRWAQDIQHGACRKDYALVRINHFLGGLVRTQCWHYHWLGSSYADCSQRQSCLDNSITGRGSYDLAVTLCKNAAVIFAGAIQGHFF